MPKRAVTSIAFGGTVIPENAVYDDDHDIFKLPNVKANLDKWFVDVNEDPSIIKRDRPVEQATAAPGEKRATRK